ncbi:hypothetical protein [Leptolyngbya sp. PCC 6406]|uniref:hypothetical protein n=1 Tax=Leptolyngbya sp. PCC 6406 TaxID=1173264 RepID=UPI000489E8CC|nr:hypothetical protein [Leptolyngbya sp. PCC 6406]
MTAPLTTCPSITPRSSDSYQALVTLVGSDLLEQALSELSAQMEVQQEPGGSRPDALTIQLTALRWLTAEIETLVSELPHRLTPGPGRDAIACHDFQRWLEQRSLASDEGA